MSLTQKQTSNGGEKCFAKKRNYTLRMDFCKQCNVPRLAKTVGSHSGKLYAKNTEISLAQASTSVIPIKLVKKPRIHAQFQIQCER